MLLDPIVKARGLRRDFVQSALGTDPLLPVASVWMGDRADIALINDTNGLREMLKHPRSDPNGLFYYQKDKYRSLLNEVFPEYNLKLNDVVLFCDVDHSSRYRSLLLKHLRQLPIDKINELASLELESWNQNVSLTRLNAFVSSILSYMLMGHSTPFNAVDVFNDGLSRRAMGLPGSDAYAAAMKEIHDTIEQTIQEAQTPFVQELIQSDFTPAQQRMLLFILFFAGQETTVSALTYIIWDLALHPEKQEEIYNELRSTDPDSTAKRIGNYSTIQKVIALGLFNHPPVAAFQRIANKDLVMEYGEEKRFIPKGRQVDACPVFAQDKAPKLTPTNYPFSYGPNSCPGQHLALVEMRLFLIALIKKFKFSTTQKDVKKQCRITLKLDAEIFLQLEKRPPFQADGDPNDFITPAHSVKPQKGGAQDAEVSHMGSH